MTTVDISIYKQIRKLRKKLRQIEHLESIDRDLSNEEVVKCMKKDSIREELLDLLQDYNADNVSPVGESDFDSTRSTINVSSCDHNALVTHVTSPQDRESDPFHSHNRSLSPARPEQKRPSSLSPTKKPKDSSAKPQKSVAEKWRSSIFSVTALEGHNDITLATDMCDKLVVSASRDTTVKIWCMDSLRELKSLGGHTGSVTDVLVKPYKEVPNLGSAFEVSDSDHLVFSVSTDCYLKVWSADTGEQLQSIYTYSPITKVCYYPEDGLIITASGGGKVELWDVVTKEMVASEHAHTEAVTGVYVSGKTICSSCGIVGEIKVFEVRDRKLHCVFVSENMKDAAGHAVPMRHVRSLLGSGDNLYYGDDGVNVKIMSWRQGLVKKLSNHKGECGMTYALCQCGDIMLTSAYDLDTGRGYLNVFDISKEAVYLATIDDGETGRILDICCHAAEEGVITIVTAGVDLLVWRKVAKKSGTNDVQARVIPQLTQFAQNSDLESETEFSETEDEASSHSGSRRTSVQGQGQGWMSWCSLV
ncbi:WD repeat-containing protein 5 homolog isoform X3 [Dreissena polymorpha]|uniref:WD repeat-containing protein 5 homolog isoform X3 n=1 Tax=Dreissena polymorpha TaxID=45954 RepID=UPI002263D7CC|nr:WD repeat-containing protein 5 homolog isoform X3 [Dreissena polymorpha]